eukprot:jgi/Chlat1/6058/Chrsp4S06342
MSGAAASTGVSKLAAAAAAIFGNAIGNGLSSGRKVLRKSPVGWKIAGYYPRGIEQDDPLYEDPLESRRLTILERMRRRGKAAPKKGQGKRAAKRK